MAVSKVIYAGKTLIDLSGDSITPEKVVAGYTAHDASGAAITGTAGITATDDGAGNVTVVVTGLSGISVE